jgi:hypothetical protein
MDSEPTQKDWLKEILTNKYRRMPSCVHGPNDFCQWCLIGSDGLTSEERTEKEIFERRVGHAFLEVLKELWKPAESPPQDTKAIQFSLLSKGRFNDPNDPWTDCVIWIEKTDDFERPPVVENLISLLKGWKG